MKDPSGWTVENNPHPYPEQLPPDDYKNFFEWDDDGFFTIKCHSCVRRSEVGSGNCMDGGEYFICQKNKVKKTIQSKLW